MNHGKWLSCLIWKAEGELYVWFSKYLCSWLRATFSWLINLPLLSSINESFSLEMFITVCSEFIFFYYLTFFFFGKTNCLSDINLKMIRFNDFVLLICTCFFYSCLHFGQRQKAYLSQFLQFDEFIRATGCIKSWLLPTLHLYLILYSLGFTFCFASFTLYEKEVHSKKTIKKVKLEGAGRRNSDFEICIVFPFIIF